MFHSRSKFTVSKVPVMKYKKGNFAELGPVNIFQFESDSVKSITCMRIKVMIIIINLKIELLE